MSSRGARTLPCLLQSLSQRTEIRTGFGLPVGERFGGSTKQPRLLSRHPELHLADSLLSEKVMSERKIVVSIFNPGEREDKRLSMNLFPRGYKHLVSESLVTSCHSYHLISIKEPHP